LPLPFVTAGATLEGALQGETHRQVRFGGGLETLSSWLAVSPRARSGWLSLSRGNRHRWSRGRNSLSGGGRNHTGRSI